MCATGNSNALTWMVNGTSLEFSSDNASLTMLAIPESSGFAVLTENSIVNGIRVLMSNITLNVSSSDVILTCQNVDQSMIMPFIIPTNGKYMYLSYYLFPYCCFNLGNLRTVQVTFRPLLLWAKFLFREFLFHVNDYIAPRQNFICQKFL